MCEERSRDGVLVSPGRKRRGEMMRRKTEGGEEEEHKDTGGVRGKERGKGESEEGRRE